jgi:hypothetical protein
MKFKDLGIGIKEIIFIAKDVTMPIVNRPIKSKIEMRNCTIPKENNFFLSAEGRSRNTSPK